MKTKNITPPIDFDICNLKRSHLAIQNIEILTHTPQGLPIINYRFENNGPRILILGGVHGDEIEGIWAAQFLLSRFIQNFPYKISMNLIPIFNPEGSLAQKRVNSRNVDLNRNLPTKDWTSEFTEPRYYPGPTAASEPETRGLIDLLNHRKPELIISLHSYKPMLNVNGNCQTIAQEIAAATNYKITSDIGYPTPGCLGTYAGLERKIPTLTYEIERGLSIDQIENVHIPAILSALKLCEKSETLQK